MSRFGNSADVTNVADSLLTDLLKQVSRSFYLTLRVLPHAVRPQIGLAYLLARTADTIADTEIVPLEQRLTALAALRARIMGSGGAQLNFGPLAQQQALPAERMLLERLTDSLALLNSLNVEDRDRVRTVIDTITSGQELDLKRFAGRKSSSMSALHTGAELDDYTYRVAGCVGEFWTKMCREHLFPDANLDAARFLADSVRFGKGLQLVNILRDLPADLRQGRCYIPAEHLATASLRPEDLLNPAVEPRFRPVYHALLTQAEAHLAAGWEYTNTIPVGQWRVRLACAWPVLIGVRTIERLRAGNVLEPGQRIKVDRAEVHDLMLRSLCLAPFPGMFRNLWKHP